MDLGVGVVCVCCFGGLTGVIGVRGCLLSLCVQFVSIAHTQAHTHLGMIVCVCWSCCDLILELCCCGFWIFDLFLGFIYLDCLDGDDILFLGGCVICVW